MPVYVPTASDGAHPQKYPEAFMREQCLSQRNGLLIVKHYILFYTCFFCLQAPSGKFSLCVMENSGGVLQRAFQGGEAGRREG